MAIERFLEQKKKAILERWFQLILKTYPPDTSRFLEQESDRFVNPVGHTFLQEIDALYDGLRQNINLDRITASLDNIIRIRSVQDFSPSEAIGFVFLLKKAVREEFAASSKNPPGEELLEFESAIDGLALLAFDRYMECREKISEIRINQVRAEKQMLERLLARANPGRRKPGLEPESS